MGIRAGNCMLERQGLMLKPWTAPPDAADGRVPRRAVLDAGTGEPLGFVALATPGSRWLRWLRPVRLEVYETEDASLLCSLRGPAFGRRAWEVRDSEDRPVALFFQGIILDAEGRRQATLERSADGGGTFVNSSGLELAAFAPSSGGTTLTFSASLEGDPFARMALLAAILAVGEHGI